MKSKVSNKKIALFLILHEKKMLNSENDLKQ